MNKKSVQLSRKYAAVLRRYLVQQQEMILQEAYELGRAAISSGMGVLDMARIHQEALVKVIGESNKNLTSEETIRMAEEFLMETLSPFEATHRGFREANAKLQQLNITLASRNDELASTNQELEMEITERRRVEQALRESEEHYRQLFEQARLMEENLRHLSNQITNVQEEERKRISRDLHDEVGQALTAINVVLAMLKNEAQDLNLQKKLSDTQNLLVQAMETMHRFARELRPAMLDDLGIIPALRSYIKAWQERTRIKVTLNAHVGVENLDGSQKTVLYRVAQESLTNVAKHAQATQVQVVIKKLRAGVQLEIGDNGKAFSVERIAGKKRLGLLGMQERVRLVNGEFSLESKVGKGTTVRVLIPDKRVARTPTKQKPQTTNQNPHYAKNHCVISR